MRNVQLKWWLHICLLTEGYQCTVKVSYLTLDFFSISWDLPFNIMLLFFTQTPAWFWFVIVLVFLNTCTVAIEHYNQPVWLTEFLCKYSE
jgi:hypothetical protein